MDYPRCATCKHWTRDHHCERAQSDFGYATDSGSLAVAHDVESYKAYLETKPDFGCVMHEPRDNA